MINAFSAVSATWALLGLIGCLLVASMALFWSVEDQRKRRFAKGPKARKD